MHRICCTRWGRQWRAACVQGAGEQPYAFGVTPSYEPHAQPLRSHCILLQLSTC